MIATGLLIITLSVPPYLDIEGDGDVAEVGLLSEVVLVCAAGEVGTEVADGG